MIDVHFHPCRGYCPPDSPTEMTFTALARTELADQITIALAARATDAATELERKVWWAAAGVARHAAGAEAPSQSGGDGVRSRLPGRPKGCAP